MFGFEIPSHVIGRKVSALQLLIDEGEFGLGFGAGEIQIVAGTVCDVAVSVISGYDLLRIIAEGVGIQTES